MSLSCQVPVKKKRTIFNTADPRFALIKWKENKNKYSVVSMNNVEKIESGEYKLNSEYRVLYNGTKYKGILVQIGNEEECTSKANRLMSPKDAEKVLRELNKGGIKICKIKVLEAEIDKMSMKMKEKDSKIKDLEKLITELNVKYVSPRGVKYTELGDECILASKSPNPKSPTEIKSTTDTKLSTETKSPRNTNNSSLKAFIDKTTHVNEQHANETVKSEECLVSKTPRSSANPSSTTNPPSTNTMISMKTYADKMVQVNDRRGRLHTKLQLLEDHVNDTARIIKEKDQRINELEKSVEDLNKKIKINILAGIKRERDIEIKNRKRMQSIKFCQMYMYGDAVNQENIISEGRMPNSEHNMVNALEKLKCKYPMLTHKYSIDSSGSKDSYENLETFLDQLDLMKEKVNVLMPESAC